MKIETVRKLTILLPLISMMVSVGIVWHQYARHDRLARKFAQDSREFIALQKQLPKGHAPVQIHDDDHDD